MEATTTDAEAIAAARGGDQDAFCALVARYQEVAFRAAFLVVRDPGTAEDVTQEGFVRAYQALGSFREGEPFRPWVLRIVTNLALNEVRSRSRRRGLLERVGRFRVELPPLPEREAEEDEERALLWQAINELREEDRVVLYLRYFLELPEREIALAIGHAPGTVKSRLSRASARLRHVIERGYPGLRRIHTAGEVRRG
ncbi:MAG: sigma-70 family RNA polymerase sigma factor [Dehalococcoidia bacterium]